LLEANERRHYRTSNNKQLAQFRPTAQSFKEKEKLEDMVVTGKNIEKTGQRNALRKNKLDSLTN
jgi:hypothetical protein